MTEVKRVVEITTRKILLAAAALASLTAIASTANICFLFFHQPEMPDSVRQMGKKIS